MNEHYNPVVTEIIRNGLLAASEEMKINLIRTSYTPMIYEAFDFTIGIFDRTGDMLSVSLGLPMFVRGMSDVIKAMIEYWGYEDIAEGDVLLTNDAYITGSHLNHMTFVVPVFHQGVLMGFSACMAHWPDVGGVRGFSISPSHDIYCEGLQMPLVKAWKAGVENDDILRIIRTNVRSPEHAMGDLRAQVGAIRVGERHLIQLCQRYGRAAFLAAVENIFYQSELLARRAVSEIPDGVYEAESFMDDDGIEIGKKIVLRVKVIVDGDKLTIDLSGLNPQVRGFYNTGKTAGLSCAGVAFKCLTSPSDYPLNAGSFRPLEVILPFGKVLSAVRPAPMRLWMIYPMTVIDTVFKALAPAIPNRVIAGHHADLVSGGCVSHSHDRHGSYFYVGLPGGGWGAKYNEDGVSATICINDGDTHNNPIEAYEARDPVVIESYCLRQDSGGAGKFRGGLGTELVFRPLDEMFFSASLERVGCRPWGLFGGFAAKGNEVAVRRRSSHMPERINTGKVSDLLLKPGEAGILRSGGGGGFSPPLERAVESVERDVRFGYVSQSAAIDLYGVVFRPGTDLADLEATRARRAQMVEAGLPVDEPDGRSEGGKSTHCGDDHRHEIRA
jgi:N-methylhydantoinase B